MDIERKYSYNNNTTKVEVLTVVSVGTGEY
jgi:hypothetical protein